MSKAVCTCVHLDLMELGLGDRKIIKSSIGIVHSSLVEAGFLGSVAVFTAA